MAVELPAIFSYRMLDLKDPESPYWDVAYTELCVYTASFIMRDVYDRFRLWALSPTILEHLLVLDLDGPLGSGDNAREFRELLGVISDTESHNLRHWWSARGEGGSRSPGPVGRGADWVYYDPLRREKVSASVAENRLRNAPTAVPAGHPVGYDYGPLGQLPGWVQPDVPAPQGAEEQHGWLDDYAVEE